MSPQQNNDGRARARARFRIFTGRTRAGRRWPRRGVQFLVAAAALATVGATVGAGSASAATLQPTAARVTGVTWHQLSPINGWVSGQSQFAGDGVPAWAVRNGVVYLSGSVAQTNGTNNEFAVLPPAARPSRVLYMTVFTWAGTQGFVIVHPDGALQAWASPYSNAQTLTSLAGISYPAQAMAMSTLSLENGWQSSDSQWGTGDPSYSVSNGMVYLSGSLHQPTGSNQVFGVLPPAAKPAHTLYLSVYTYNGTIGLLEIDTSGTMYAYFGGAQQYTSLAGVSFPVPSAAHKLALYNGWQSAQGLYNTGDPSYTVSDGVVYLSGSIYQPSGTSEIFAVLPKAARPKHTLYIQVMVYTPDNTAHAGTLLIEPDGAMEAYSQTSSEAQTFTSLAGLSFPLGS